MIFIPNNLEQNLINIIQKYCREEFALIRMTFTMLDKSTIDASGNIKIILEDKKIVNYSKLTRGEKYREKALILSQEGIVEETVSFYHPNAKPHKADGDPRFWVYGFKKIALEGTLVYYTIFNKKLVVIPIIEHNLFEQNLKDIFGNSDTEETIIEELLMKFKFISQKGWVESIAPPIIESGKLKSAPKDAGETFEKLFEINPNNLGLADYKGQIELKTKRMKVSNKDTLFARIPDWEISPIKSVAEMILKYGYLNTHEKYSEYMDLHITVKNTPNNQGLFLVSNDDKEILTQYHLNEGKNIETVNWKYSSLKTALFNKHPKTLWVVVEENIVNGKVYFKYTKAQLTQKPIFSQFTNLINQGIITYDWRGRVRLDGSKGRDRGHAFRILPKHRSSLFGDLREINFEN